MLIMIIDHDEYQSFTRTLTCSALRYIAMSPKRSKWRRRSRKLSQSLGGWITQRTLKTSEPWLAADMFVRNFAGITGGAVTVEDMDVNHFEKIMSVNSTGLMLCCKHEIRQMAKQEPLTSYVMSDVEIAVSLTVLQYWSSAAKRCDRELRFYQCHDDHVWYSCLHCVKTRSPRNY